MIASIAIRYIAKIKNRGKIKLFNNLNPIAFEEVIHRVSDAVAILERPRNSRLMAKFSPILPHLEYDIVYVNEAFCDFLGKKKNEKIVQPLLSALPYSDKLLQMSEFLRPINSHESYNTTLSFAGIDGEFEVEIHPIAKQDPRVERKILLIRKLEEPKEKPQDNGGVVEVLGRPRNIRMSRRMISDLSHEIRTPLNAIIGFSELMQSMEQAEFSSSKGKNGDYLRDIISSGRDLLMTLTSMMELARYDGGHTVDEEMESDLSESLKFIAADADGKFGEPRKVRVRGFRRVVPVKIEQMTLERIISWVLGFLCRLSEKEGKITVSSIKSKCGRAAVRFDIEQPLAYRGFDAPRAESNEFTCNDEENSFNLFLARRFLKIFGGYIEVMKDEERNVVGIKLYLPLAELKAKADIQREFGLRVSELAE